MASEIDICNQALSRLGIDDFIESFDDPTNEASVARLHYADGRDRVLAAYPWPFATRREALALSATESPRPGWQYVYTYPQRALQPRAILPDGIVWNASYRAPLPEQRIPYAIEAALDNDNKVILCDLETPTLVYTARITDPLRFDPLFMNALKWHLASEFAMPLAVKKDFADRALKMYELTVGEAISMALSGQREDPSPDSEIIQARF